MNKDFILSNLQEAKEELDRLIEDIYKDNEFNYDDYYVALQHLYHHLNTSWNARKENKDILENCTEDDFNKWRKFPEDFDINT
jgi:hypothetical protein